MPTTLPAVADRCGGGQSARLRAHRIRRLLVGAGAHRDGHARVHRRADEPDAPGMRRARACSRSRSRTRSRRERADAALAARGAPARRPAANAGRGATLRRRLRARQGLRARRRRPVARAPRRSASCSTGGGRRAASSATGPAVDFARPEGRRHQSAGRSRRRRDRRALGARRRDVPFLHPGKAAVVRVAGAAVGVAGGAPPAKSPRRSILLGKSGSQSLTSRACLSMFRAASRPGALPRYPAVTRDIAVIVDEGFLADTILEEVRSFGDSRIESARLFDCYRGAPIAAGQQEPGLYHRVPCPGPDAHRRRGERPPCPSARPPARALRARTAELRTPLR